MIPGLSRQLSTTQIDYLLDHADGDRPIVHNQREDATRNSLIFMKLIRVNEAMNKPKHTVLTDDGREAFAAICEYMVTHLLRIEEAKTQNLYGYLPKEYIGRWRDWRGN
jgi:hypothetical protein